MSIKQPDQEGESGAITSSSRAPVREFWRLMATNDFDAVAMVLAADFVLEWPQSRERIRGAANFARMNAAYPAHGPWRFTVKRLLADGDQVVTQVEVTDGVQRAEAVSFFELRDGLIVRLTEFWPDPYEARADRAQWVERMD